MKTKWVVLTAGIILSITAAGITGCGKSAATISSLPVDYQGTPFKDSTYQGGPQVIPGKLQCAFYDLGGEGIAYHDTDAINHGSGELNTTPQHERPHATAAIWHFRRDEGMDISYVKDTADLSHPNFFTPTANQLYLGWTSDEEWCNYTVNVKKAGTYKIIALYSNAANTIRFSINRQPACECKLPKETGDWHIWNKAEIGSITFGQAGVQLLTLHYNAGNNFAYFEFEAAD